MNRVLPILKKIDEEGDGFDIENYKSDLKRAEEIEKCLKEAEVANSKTQETPAEDDEIEL
jgi:hypothetical protein